LPPTRLHRRRTDGNASAHSRPQPRGAESPWQGAARAAWIPVCYRRPAKEILMNLSRHVFATLAVLALFLVAPPARRAHAEVKPGDKAADFDGATLNGAPLRLSSLRGKVVLLDFWASWCEPCKKELPLLAKLAPRLKTKGIEIVAVNIDDDKAKASAFMKSRGLLLTVVADDGKKIVSRWEPPKMPSSFVVDKAGVVRAVHAGFEPGDETKLEAELTALVQK
jgi:cytochrome c biogenesis protein CcmG/thiol:disulfide interchange protein DsbE